jgi:hypothetical protein
MTCATGALCAALISFSLPASPPEHRIVVVDSNPVVIRAKLIDAAAKVCTAARAQDPFGEFGSQDECIENTLNGARRQHIADRHELAALKAN